MKLLVIFDPADSTARPRFERTQEAVTTWLMAQDHPAAYQVHEHRISDDVDTLLHVLNGDFCWPTPLRAWQGTSRAGLKSIELPQEARHHA